MLNFYAEVVTAASRPYRITLRSRVFEESETKDGYCIIKHMNTNDFALSHFGAGTWHLVKINGKERWGAGFTWEKAKKFVESYLESLTRKS